MPNPFTPFQIATGDRFINRVAETKTILERVTKGASSGIVGNPHIGKSSLLRRISEPEVVAQFVPQPDKFIFVDVDFQSFVPGDKPENFWVHILEDCTLTHPEAEPFFKPLLENKTFDSRRLLSALTRLGRSGRRVVLLIDEFDYLFNLPNFKTLDFLGPLRVLVMKSDGLVLVTASRLSVAELNQKTAECRDEVRGSDLFNYLEEVPLGSFSPTDIYEWLQRHGLASRAIEEMLSLAGQHPLLLQLAGELCYEADLTNDRTCQQLRTNFVRKAETQFQDVWNYLNPKAQVALVIFTLDQLNNQLPSGEKLSLEQKEKYLAWYEAEVKRMVRQGTLETSVTGDIYIGSHAFLQWIFDHKIVGTRGADGESFTQWLTDKQYKLGGLLTQEEIDWLHRVWQKIPSGLIDLARKAILPEYLQ